jgi:hypothetical protein
MVQELYREVSLHLTEERDYLLHGDDYMDIDKMISWSQDAVGSSRRIIKEQSRDRRFC